MRKSGRKIKHHHRSVPMILHREGDMLTLEIRQEGALLTAIKFGVMQKMHFDKLVEISNLAKIADQIKHGSTCHFQPALEAILQSMFGRHEKHGCIGVNAQERKLLPILIAQNEVYWKGQTTTFYNHCGRELNLFYKEKQIMQPLGEAA